MKLITFLFLILSPFFTECANNCGRQILDKTRILSSNDVNRFKSEIKTWETILTSVITSCWSPNFRYGGCNTRFVLFERDSKNVLNYVKNAVWLLGQCDNTSILLYSTGQKECSIFQLINHNKSNFSASLVKSESQIVVNFMSYMLHFFFNSAVGSNFYQNEKWNYFSLPPCEIVAGILAIPNNKTTESSASDEVSQKNSSEHDLTKHHGGGGITDAVLTIICAICGSTALSFLLFFRRIRHCICTVCGLCRDTDRLLSDMG